MIIRSMNKEKEFPEGKTVMDCLKALDAFPKGTLAAQSGGVVCELILLLELTMRQYTVIQILAMKQVIPSWHVSSLSVQ